MSGVRSKNGILMERHQEGKGGCARILMVVAVIDVVVGRETVFLVLFLGQWVCYGMQSENPLTCHAKICLLPEDDQCWPLWCFWDHRLLLKCDPLHMNNQHARISDKDASLIP